MLWRQGFDFLKGESCIHMHGVIQGEGDNPTMTPPKEKNLKLTQDSHNSGHRRNTKLSFWEFWLSDCLFVWELFVDGGMEIR